MRLSLLPEILFDEFPSDETVKYCIFTQPMYPGKDYSEYREKVMFCGTESTLFVMASLKKLSLRKVCVLSERRTKIKCSTPFSIRAFPTGSDSGSVMLLIQIEDSFHLYTGRFSQCRRILLSSILLSYRNTINDIYVDNTMAGLKVPCILQRASHQIKQIVSDYPDYTIYLHVEIFGYEDLLLDLARSGIKIKLIELQTILFNQRQLSHLFEFEGEPQIKVYALFREREPFTQRDYQRYFDEEKKIHVKLLMSQHEFHEQETIKGLIFVPFTPHAGAYELHDLFQMIQPKRIHPLVKQGFMDDQMCVIPDEILNEDGQIIDFKPFNELDESFNSEASRTGSNRSFLELSSVVSGDLSDMSSELHLQIYDLESQSLEPTASERMNSDLNRTTSNAIRITPVEIISIDSEEDEEQDIFEIATITNDEHTNETNKPSDESNTKETESNAAQVLDKQTEQQPNLKETSEKTSPETETSQQNPPQNHPIDSSNVQQQITSPQPAGTVVNPQKKSDANNNGDGSSDAGDTSRTDHRKETLATERNKEVKAKTNYRPITRFKRKTTAVSPQRFHRIQRVEHLPDSEEESESEKEQPSIKTPKVRKKSNDRPTTSQTLEKSKTGQRNIQFKLPAKNRGIKKITAQPLEKIHKDSVKSDSNQNQKSEIGEVRNSSSSSQRRR